MLFSLKRRQSATGGYMAQQEKKEFCDKMSFMLNDLSVTVCVNPLVVVIRDIVKHRVAWVDAIRESCYLAIRFIYFGCLYLKISKMRYPVKNTRNYTYSSTSINASTCQELT